MGRNIAMTWAPAPPTSPYPLIISADDRHLVSPNGDGFQIFGDTPWDLVTLSASDRALYLDDRVSRGFNAIAWELTIPAGFGGINDAGNPTFSGNLVGGEDDFATPNAQWWGQAADLLQECADRELLQFVFPLYLGFNGGSEGHYADMVANDVASGTKLGVFGAYVGTLLQPFENVIVVLGGDFKPNSAGLALVKKIADGIKTTDRAGRIYTFHCGPNEQTHEIDAVTGGYRASINSDWIGLEYAYESWGGGNEFSSFNAQDNYSSSPTNPFVYFEGHYEDSPTSNADAHVLRRQSWSARLNGAFGTFFGQEGVWNFQAGWQSKLNSTPTIHQGHLRSFFLGRDWKKLVPSTGSGLVSSGGGTSNTAGYKARALASDGSWGAIYVADGSATTVSFSGFSGTKSVKWFDPTNGSTTAASPATHVNSGTQSYTPSGTNSAGNNDWVLVIE
jgi:hypothetical protein